MGEASNSAPFEGETAINSQSGYARELLTKIVGNSPSIGQNEEIKSALSALGDIVTRQGHVTVSNTGTNHALINRALSDVDPGKLDRPPWTAVKEMLDRARSKLCVLHGASNSTDTGRISNHGICGNISFLQVAQSL